MKSVRRSLGIFAATVAAAAMAATGVAAAAPGHGRDPHHLRPPVPHHQSPGRHFPPPPAQEAGLFVQTDNTSGNSVVAYRRNADGTLTETGNYATGGNGGQLEGSVVDHTASQGALAIDRQDHLLYAVNAGSDTITEFAVLGTHLQRLAVLPSGGEFPVSVTTHGNLVYVLNARGGGSIQGYVQIAGHLTEVGSWNRPLGLDPTATPEFTHTPGQVAFTPNGSQLVVTTKGNTSSVDVFGVDGLGRPSSAPTVTALPGAVPFAVEFDQAGHLLIAEAGTNAVASFALGTDGSLTPIATVPTGQEATCWIAGAGPYEFVSNAASGSVSGFSVDGGGALTPLGNTATNGGTVDATAAGRFLYVQAGAEGIVDEFRIEAGGSLSPIGSVTVPGAVGGEGIVAS